MDSEKMFMELKKTLKSREAFHQKVIVRLEKIAAMFSDIVKKALDPKATVKLNVFPASKIPQAQRQGQHFVQLNPERGEIFAAEFVIEAPHFADSIGFCTIYDISQFSNDEVEKTLIKQIHITIMNDVRLHDAMIYQNTNGFGHCWRDPIAEGQKKIVMSQVKKIDDEEKGESWKGGE
jgi:hypothetical protein